MLGVSGCGKTRTILETLYHHEGIYFTGDNRGGIGLQDFWQCMTEASMSTKRVHDFVKRLFHCIGLAQKDVAMYRTTTTMGTVKTRICLWDRFIPYFVSTVYTRRLSS